MTKATGGRSAKASRPDKRRIAFEKGLRALRAYVRVHGTADVPAECVVSGFALGYWVSWRKDKYAMGAMSRSEARVFESIRGWRWRVPHNTIPLPERLRSLRAFIRRYGHSQVPDTYKDPRTGSRLGYWTAKCRRRYRVGRLPRQTVKALVGVKGWSWPVDWRRRSFEEVLGLLRVFVQKHGHADVPAAYRHPRTNFCLGQWVAIRRRHYKAGQLAAWKVKALQKLPGWVWSGGTHRRYGQLLRELSVYEKKHGHVRMTNTYRTRSGFRLGSRVSLLRARYPDRLTREEICAFEAFPGWSWKVTFTSDRFMRALELLREFQKERGHTRLPKNYRRGGIALVQWATHVRRLCRTGKLAPERRRLVEKIPGWSWTPQPTLLHDPLPARSKKPRAP